MQKNKMDEKKNTRDKKLYGIGKWLPILSVNAKLSFFELLYLASVLVCENKVCFIFVLILMIETFVGVWRKKNSNIHIEIDSSASRNRKYPQ